MNPDPAPRPAVDPDLAVEPLGPLGASRDEDRRPPEAPEAMRLRVQADIAPAESPLGRSRSALADWLESELRESFGR